MTTRICVVIAKVFYGFFQWAKIIPFYIIGTCMTNYKRKEKTHRVNFAKINKKTFNNKKDNSLHSTVFFIVLQITARFEIQMFFYMPYLLLPNIMPTPASFVMIRRLCMLAVPPSLWSWEWWPSPTITFVVCWYYYFELKDIRVL